VIVIGPYGSEQGAGLTLPEQRGKIPSSFTGYIWAEDIWTIGPALRPSRDIRTKEQEEAAARGLKRRRAAAD
jgi:glycerophosphoryl diester phosphodiesterase